METQLTNLALNNPQLEALICHITNHPADPLHNALILHGNILGGTLALQRLKANFHIKYPQKEVLYYKKDQFNAFIKRNPVIFLQNFYKLRPNLLAVLIDDMTLTDLSLAEQDKMAVFLKMLVAHKIQVVASYRHYEEYAHFAKPIMRELWSWYMSGREFHIAGSSVIYTKPLITYLTCADDRKLWDAALNLDLNRARGMGIIQPGVLCNERPRSFGKDMPFHISIKWLGGKDYKNTEFPKVKCPFCGEHELIPYYCEASWTIGAAHYIKFYCVRCHERLVTDDMPDYHQLVCDLLPRLKSDKGC